MNTSASALLVLVLAGSAAAAVGASKPGERQMKSCPPLPVLDRNCSVDTYGGRYPDGYGAWSLCSERLSLGRPNIFSVGIGGDVSFDSAVVKRHTNAFVWCFDPSISRKRFESLVRGHARLTPDELRRIAFYPFGLSHTDDVMPMFRSEDRRIGSLVSTPGVRGYSEEAYLQAPLLRLLTLQFVALRGRAAIDVLKIDAEVCARAQDHSSIQTEPGCKHSRFRRLACELLSCDQPQPRLR